MRETQKRESPTLLKNLKGVTSPILKSEQAKNNNVNENLRIVSSDKKYLALQQLNNYQSDFFVLVLLTIVPYIFILDTALRLGLKSGLIFNTTLQTVWGIIGYQFIKRSVLPKEIYGLTFKNWKPVVKEAILWSVGFMLVALFLKWLFITFTPAFHETPLLTFRVFHTLGWSKSLLMVTCYVLFVPAQELISRGLLQGSLQHIFSGRLATTKAILMTTLVFSALHLITHPWLAYTVFLPSIFWGVLFARQRSLIGVSVSHLILGVFFLYFEYLPISELIHF